jgi:carboxypeptidase Q
VDLNRSILRGCVLTASLALFGSAIAQGDPAVIEKIIAEGKSNSKAMELIRDLTDIGPRLSSSTYLSKAEQWTMDRFTDFGLVNVHREQWGEYPVGFDRGKRQVGRMIEPFPSDFQFTTPSWTPGTKGLVRAQAILAPTTIEEFEKVKGKLKGKWLIVPSGSATPRRGESAEPNELEKAILGSGMAGRVFASRNDLVLTSGRHADLKWENLPKDVRVVVRRSDMDRITRNLEKESERGPVILEFDLEQKFVKGPRPQYNVIAEIRGTEKPDEVIIVSGHLDSWDGPGSVGAVDNATGVISAIESARLLMAAGAKPKRTIRFVLWTGEEQGLFGSREYVKQHEKDLDRISAVFVDDGGTNYIGGYVGIETQKAMFEKAFAPVVAAFPEMPMVFEARATMPRGGGSDHSPFNQVGVPGFFTMETGRANYQYAHHTQHDKLDQVIPEYLRQSAVAHAVVAYNLACADTMVPRGPKPEPQPEGQGGRGGGGTGGSGGRGAGGSGGGGGGGEHDH